MHALTSRTKERGQATVELALLLPVLLAITMGTIDLGRGYSASVAVSNAAYQAAMYGSGSATLAADTTGIRNAALADAADLGTSLTVVSGISTDPYGSPSLSVTVSYAFPLFSYFPGLPQTIPIVRTATMRVKQ